MGDILSNAVLSLVRVGARRLLLHCAALHCTAALNDKTTARVCTKLGLRAPESVPSPGKEAPRNGDGHSALFLFLATQPVLACSYTSFGVLAAKQALSSSSIP